jgi:secernin
MIADLVAALPRTTRESLTLFGHNGHLEGEQYLCLRRQPAHAFSPGEQVQVSQFILPQVRHTLPVLAAQLPGQWGYVAGVNGKGVAVGVTATRTRLAPAEPALAGTDLVRLVLERSSSARQGVDVLTDLISRYGQGASSQASDSFAAGNSLLVADGQEAHVVEAADRHWVLHTIEQTRAVSNFCLLHQDWNRIARGLAEVVLERGWWPGDGSKLDFAATLGCPDDRNAGLPRWGRATLLLEQHSGDLDLACFRRLLRDHGEGPPRADHAAGLCRHAAHGTLQTAGSLIAALPSGPEEIPLVWWAFGPPCRSVYLPVTFHGSLPRAWTEEATSARAIPALQEKLRGRLGDPLEYRKTVRSFELLLDELACEFTSEAASLGQRQATSELESLGQSFLEHTLERLENLIPAAVEPTTGEW